MAALGTGGAWTASKLINGSQIKPHTITAKQIKKGSLDATVFSGSLPRGERGPIGPPGVPGKDGTAAELEPEPPIRVGLGDSPCSTEYCGHFCNGEFGGWADYEEGFATVAFFKDKQGFVHLQGTLRGLGGPIPPVSFYLPPGDRPLDGTREFTYRACGGTLACLDIRNRRQYQTECRVVRTARRDLVSSLAGRPRSVGLAPSASHGPSSLPATGGFFMALCP